jgi:hypothetical protein
VGGFRCGFRLVVITAAEECPELHPLGLPNFEDEGALVDDLRFERSVELVEGPETNVSSLDLNVPLFFRHFAHRGLRAESRR